MRDPKRIYDFCNKLATIWATECPDWRFGQLMCNVLNTCGRDPFFYEEDEMLKVFEEYFGIVDESGVKQ
jgi:hypothetical protein